MKDKRVDRMKEFLMCLAKMNPLEMIGVAKVLGVEVIEGENLDTGTERPFEILIDEMMDKFDALTTKRQKNLLKMMRKSTKEK
jgi:hypothetical protein